MTQADSAQMPQLSLQRYLDLVKRRRWQVLPVSLLGLVVGGIIAFFIPRYYVAETALFHQGDLLNANEEDPMRSVVASATEMIPLVARKVITEKLKWPEVVGLDEHDLEQFAKGVRSRVTVFDANAGERKRYFALIHVAYRDRDGRRAAEFLNAAVKTWIETRLDDLRKRYEAERKAATAEVETWTKTYDDLLERRQELELRFEIEPDADLATQRSVLKMRLDKRAELEAELRAKGVELAALTKLLDQLRDGLATLPERVPVALAAAPDAARGSPAAASILAMVAYYQEALTNLVPGTRTYRTTAQNLAAAQKRLLALLAPPTESKDGLVDNPVRLQVQKELQAAEVRHAALAKTVEDLLARFTESTRIEERIKGFAEYSKALLLVEDARKSRDEAQAARRKAEDLLARINSEAPIRQQGEAAVPPRPTEPNILVVALIGCVLGLGAAIGLILLLDLLQGSFKTVDDVERGLPVPVLGGFSHLETDAERRAAVRGRTRATVIAFVFVALVVAVALIFYLAPTRLPPVVRDLLALVLGGR